MILHLQLPPTPEYAPQLAELAVNAARTYSQIELDYTPASLASVDQIIEGFRKDGVSAEQMMETLFAFGCYVGEVLIREYDARWRLTSETRMKDVSGFPLVVEFGTENFCNPLGRVYKRMANGDVDSLVGFYESFVRSTLAAEQVPPEAVTPAAVEKKGLWKRLFGG